MEDYSQNALLHFDKSGSRTQLVAAIGDRPDVDDLSQEIYGKLAAALRSDAVSNPSGYIRGITKRIVIDWRRRLARRREVSLPDNQVDRAEGPDRLAEVSETCLLVREAITALPYSCRIVAELHYLQEMPLEHVADILNRKYETVRKQNGRAIAQLREHPGLAKLLAT